MRKSRGLVISLSKDNALKHVSMILSKLMNVDILHPAE